MTLLLSLSAVSAETTHCFVFVFCRGGGGHLQIFSPLRDRLFPADSLTAAHDWYFLYCHTSNQSCTFGEFDPRNVSIMYILIDVVADKSLTNTRHHSKDSKWDALNIHRNILNPPLIREVASCLHGRCWPSLIEGNQNIRLRREYWGVLKAKAARQDLNYWTFCHAEFAFLVGSDPCHPFWNLCGKIHTVLCIWHA